MSADSDRTPKRYSARQLRELDLAEHTLVWFASDNGPWLPYRQRGGSAGLLRGGKASCWEGGMRVPTIAWWPGTVPAAHVQRGIGSTLDLLPTFAALAGATRPEVVRYLAISCTYRGLPSQVRATSATRSSP